MLVLSSVAIREAHPSPRFCVWDLQDVISLLNRDNHRSLPKLVGETLRVSNFNSSSCLCFLFERTGHLQGFTYMPKFTLWESLTPEPPELNWGIGTTYPSQNCQSSLTLNCFSLFIHFRRPPLKTFVPMEM